MALITQISEITPYLPMAYATNPEALPSISIAETKHLIPILGEDLYSELETAYHDNTLTPSETALLDKCRAVIVPFSYTEDLALRQVLLTDNGLIALENTNSRKAFKWEYNNALEAMQARGYAAQEMLIQLLRKHSADYPLWASSSYCDPEGFLLIRDGSDLRGLLGLQQEHRVYMMLRPVFATIAETSLKPLLSETFYDALNARILANTSSAQELNILPKLRMYAARMAMVAAAAELNVKFSSYGFTVVDTRIKDEISDGRTNANDMQMDRFRTQMEDSARVLIEQVKAYMNANASSQVFPEYFTSAAYKDPNKQCPTTDNGRYRGVFSV